MVDSFGHFSVSYWIFSLSIIKVSYAGGGMSKPMTISYFGGKSAASAAAACGF